MFSKGYDFIRSFKYKRKVLGRIVLFKPQNVFIVLLYSKETPKGDPYRRLASISLIFITFRAMEGRLTLAVSYFHNQINY